VTTPKHAHPIPTTVRVFDNVGAFIAESHDLQFTGGSVTIDTLGRVVVTTGGAGGLTDHDHTSTALDGGVLTKDEHDNYEELLQIGTPAGPAANKVRFYAKLSAGIAKLFYLQSDGTEVGPLGTGGGSGATQRTFAFFAG
jgi:hypothetical protein